MRVFSTYRLLCLLVFSVVFALVGSLFQPQPATATAGIFKQINFQGKVVNKTTGTNIADNTYSFTFSIYNVDTGGAAIWTETKNVQVTNGIFQTLLGSSTALPGDLNFNTQELYLGVNFNSDGEMLPRVRFAAVPYAFNALKVAGLTVTDTTGTLTIPAATIAFSGANNVTFTSSGTTGVTLPTTGTLATLAGTEEFTNKTIGSTGLVFSGATNDITTVSNQHLALMPDGTGNIGIGDTTPDAKLNILATSEQLRLDNDDSNYASFTVDPSGDLTLSLTGTATSFSLTTDGTGDGEVVLPADSIGPTELDDAGTTLDAGEDEMCLTYEHDTAKFAWQTCGSGGGALDTLTAATTNDTALLNADNSIIWEWAMTNANRRGVTIGESAAAINGVGNQFLFELTTDAGSTAGPLSIISNSADAGDIEFDLNSEGDFLILDGGAAFATFDGAGFFQLDNIKLDANTLSTTTGDLTIDTNGNNVLIADALNVGGATEAAYNFFADTLTGKGNANVASDNDLYIEGALEVDGQIQFDTLSTSGLVLSTSGVLSSVATIGSSYITDNDLTTSDLSATLTFLAGDVLNLAASTDQGKGLILPQGTATNPTNPASGEGHVYWETDTDTLRVYNGATWTSFGASTSYTFENGLTNSSGTVKLGGALTGDTTITQDGAEVLTFANGGSGNIVFNLSSTGDFVINDGVSDLLKLNDDGTIDVVSAATTADAIDITLASLTEGAAIDLNLDALTSGDGLRITSTSTALTSGSLIDLLWNPGTSERFSTGDIFKIDLGQFANPLNLFALYDNAVKLFGVSQQKITSALPHEFTAVGDVSVAYDLVFTNQTASLIDSYGPLTISSGESFENNNLTLRAYGTGNVVVEGSGLSLASGENLILDSDDGGDSYMEFNNASNYISFFVDGTEEVRFLNTSSIHTNNDIVTGQDFDIAETYPTFDETLRPGDIVSIRPDNNTGIPAVVEKTTTKTEAAMIGVVSTSPAYIMGTGSFAGEFCSLVITEGVDAVVEQERARLLSLEDKAAEASASATASEAASLAEQDKLIKSSIDEILVSKRSKAEGCLAAKQVLVTLAGRIPLKVSLENGPILPGDALAFSSQSGLAVKAVKPSQVVAKALEPYTEVTEDGKIMAFANLTYYPGGNQSSPLVAGTSVELAGVDLPAGTLQYSAGALIITGDVSVTKTLFAENIYAASSLATGVIQIDGLDGSISTKTGDLRLQTGDSLGNVDIFNSLLVFTPDGGIISQSDVQANHVKAQEVIILGAQDSQEDASVGSASVTAGSTTTTVTNTLVKTMSKIFLTPTSATGGQSLVLENKIDGAFTVSIDHAHTSDITFDYWIVGVE